MPEEGCSMGFNSQSHEVGRGQSRGDGVQGVEVHGDQGMGWWGSRVGEVKRVVG